MPSVYILVPISRKAKAWVKKHLPKDAMTFGDGIVVEWRYIDDIFEGMVDAGMKPNKDFKIRS
jgi:hypothetical protein